MRRSLGVLVVVALLAVLAVPVARATTPAKPPPAKTKSKDVPRDIKVRSMLGTITCLTMAAEGSVTFDGGLGNGGTGVFGSAAFTGCSTGVTAVPVVAQNLPWSWTMTSTGGTIAGARIQLTIAGVLGPAACAYGGSLAWPYDAVTGERDVSGSWGKFSGPSSCPPTVDVSGSWDLTDYSTAAPILP